MVHQPDRDIDVLAEVAEDEGSGQQDLRFVRVDSKCPPSKIDTGVSGRFRVFAPTHHLEPEVTMGRQGESRAIMRIALYRCPRRSSARTLRFFSKEPQCAKARRCRS
jgi:hypothetical protein